MRKALRGFTIIELVVVIVVIGILSTIGAVSYVKIQQKSRDDQRFHQSTIIGEALEKYYDKNGKYPTCAELKTNPTQILNGIDKDVLVAPTETDKSKVSISCESDSEKPATGSDVFYYETTEAGTAVTSWQLKNYSEVAKGESTKTILNRRGNTTVSVAPNGQFTLTVNKTGTGSGIFKVNGLEISDNNWNKTFGKGATIGLVAEANTGSNFTGWSGCPLASNTVTLNENMTCTATFSAIAVVIATPAEPAIATSINLGNVVANLTPVTCQAGTTPEYKILKSINNAAWGDWGDWSSTVTDSGASTQGYKYNFKAKARCIVGMNASAESSVADAEIIHVPDKPSVFTLSPASQDINVNVLTLSPVITCGSSTTPNYYLIYRIDLPIKNESGTIIKEYTEIDSLAWVNYDNVGIKMPHNIEPYLQGFTYTYIFKARCAGLYANSGDSDSTLSASVYRKIKTPTGGVVFSINRDATYPTWKVNIISTPATGCDTINLENGTDTKVIAMSGMYNTWLDPSDNNTWPGTGGGKNWKYYSVLRKYPSWSGASWLSVTTPNLFKLTLEMDSNKEVQTNSIMKQMIRMRCVNTVKLKTSDFIEYTSDELKVPGY